MARYIVEFKAFKTKEWYIKTETDHFSSACSVAATCHGGRAYRVTDTETGAIVEEWAGAAEMYQRYEE